MYESLKIDQLGSVQRMFSLQGKKALVTGAAGGIGRATANAFAELGADVALMDIPERAADLERCAEFIAQKHGVDALPLTGDVANEASVEAFVGRAAKALGTLDIVHSNAGIAGGKNLGADIPMETWQKMLGVNLTGMLLVGRAAAGVMVANGHGGSVIFTASMSGHIINKAAPGARYAPGYPATKAGVLHLAKSMAMDYAPHRIRFNTISPGIVLSGLHDGWDPAILDEAAKMIPMQRFASLDEVAGVAAFLASDLSSYMTGADILVDGGYCVW